MAAIVDGKAVTAILVQPNYDGSFTSGHAEYLAAISARRKVLMFAFAPKAAGTFLRSAAIEAIGGQLVRSVHAQGGRDAQPYIPIFIEYFLGGVTKGPMVTHVHMQALPANRHFLKVLGIKPVIMLRPIPDMLASYWDMLTQSAEARSEGLNCLIPSGFSGFSDADKADFMIDMIGPWYVSYFATWLEWLRDEPDTVCMVNYDDFKAEPAGVLEVALRHAGMARSFAACQKAIDKTWKDRSALRFNQGTAGRGKGYFLEAHIARLSRQMRFHPVLNDWHSELL